LQARDAELEKILGEKKTELLRMYIRAEKKFEKAQDAPDVVVE
jgi:hypothetical protein